MYFKLITKIMNYRLCKMFCNKLCVSYGLIYFVRGFFWSITITGSQITPTAVSNYDRWMSGLCRVTKVILQELL